MEIYLSLFFSLLILSYLFKNKKIYIFIFLILILFSGLRSTDIGADTDTYFDMLQYPERSLYLKEKGYYYLNILAHNLGFNRIFFFVTISIIILSPIFYYLFKEIKPRYRWMILCLYLFNPYLYIQSNFNILRQVIAMSLSLILLFNYFNKKYFYVLIFFALALSFHFSIIIAFIILMMSSIINWDRVKLFNFITFMFILKISGIFHIFIIYISYFFSNYGYLHYYNYRENLFSSNFIALLHYIFFIFILFFSYANSYINKKEKKLINLFHLTNAMFFLFSLNAVFLRIYIYFYLWDMYIFAIIIKNIKYKLVIVIYLLYVFMLFIAFFILNKENINYVPYRISVNFR